MCRVIGVKNVIRFLRDALWRKCDFLIRLFRFIQSKVHNYSFRIQNECKYFARTERLDVYTMFEKNKRTKRRGLVLNWKFVHELFNETDRRRTECIHECDVHGRTRNKVRRRMTSSTSEDARARRFLLRSSKRSARTRPARIAAVTTTTTTYKT